MSHCLAERHFPSRNETAVLGAAAGETHEPAPAPSDAGAVPKESLAQVRRQMRLNQRVSNPGFPRVVLGITRGPDEVRKTYVVVLLRALVTTYATPIEMPYSAMSGTARRNWLVRSGGVKIAPITNATTTK